MTNQNEIIETPCEIIKGDALNQITNAEISCQIATAHQFPRSLEQFKKRSIGMATIDVETAASCIYRRPVGRDDGGQGQKHAEGLSVRMAEIVAASYGNIRVGAMIVEQTDRYIKARGYAHDLEANFASTSEVIESTVKKDGQPYSERQRIVVAKVCLAKARRDATFQVVPKALCRPVEIEARKVAVGDAKTLEDRRARVMEWVKSLKIDLKRVFGALNVAGEGDIGLGQLEVLTGLKTALKDGDITLEEAFPENYMPAEKVFSEPPPQEGFRASTAYQKIKEGFRNGKWREVEVHWGTAKMPMKGHTLGALEKEQKQALHFLRETWEPKPYKGKISTADLALRCALDAAKEEHEKKSEEGIQSSPGEMFPEDQKS